MIVYYRFDFGREKFRGKGEVLNIGNDFIAIKVTRLDGSVRYTTIPKRWVVNYREETDETGRIQDEKREHDRSSD